MSIQEEMDKYLEMYARKFGDGFPMYQYGRGRDDAEIVAAIKRCISLGKDAYELKLVSDEEDVMY